ncbi:hypothetical protein [Crassaminicella profunda]|uniref:hypothetical protein n=1 Tax=Crassaminicella profunda TaxID=1286698 RepID=UPI001CA6CB93|nr:hypothetical protein [Crassaminicella profunda]QZY53601.1 hypothetical protein K7H06_11050 [Crassaminicella profunda]
MVEPEQAKAVTTYLERVEGTKITLDSGRVANIIKAGVKERKGQYTLIYRYQLV